MQTINIYTYNELSDNSKQIALDNYRTSDDDTAYYSSYDILTSLVESLTTLFEKCNDIKLTNYNLDINGSYISIEFTQDDCNSLTGSRALAWLENNLLSNLRIPRNEYVSKRKAYLRYGDSYRTGCYRNIARLTGLCADDTFLDALITRVKDNYTLKKAFEALADVYTDLAYTEYEYTQTTEYISDHLLVNNYMFFENGNTVKN